MLERLFGGDNFLAQTRALDASALRHQTIAHNLANANTPNFKRQEVQFETQLAQTLDAGKRSGPKFGASPVSEVQARLVTISNTSSKADGNNVNLELESAHLAENALRFEVLSQSVTGYFSGLKNVINGGR